MIEGSAILVVDLGNSSTKCTVMYGKNAKTGKYNERSFELPNEFSAIDSDYVVSSDYNEETSAILCMNSVIGARRVVGNYCNGELQRKEKNLSAIRPSATQKKYTLPSTVLSYNLAFYYASRHLLAMNRSTDYSQLNVSWKVVTLLPPGDVEVGAPQIEAIIRGITEVKLAYPCLTLPIKVEAVKVLPEGFCAYMGVVYDKGLVIRPDSKYLTEETVLIIDIGAGTTDCLIIDNNGLVQNSKYTITQGGNNVFQGVRKALRMQGIDLPDEKIKQGIITGMIKDGASLVNISNIINQAKDDVANKIISEFQDFLEGTDTRVRSIGYILVCGGGAMEDSDASEVKALSENVIENFKILAPHCKEVSVPEHEVRKVKEDGSVVYELETISLRDLNLVGASIAAETL